jgi:hypothetical protein
LRLSFFWRIFRKRSGCAERGRRTILWSATDHQDEELMEEETAETRSFLGGAELVRIVRTF